jgi:hypothetical protein
MGLARNYLKVPPSTVAILVGASTHRRKGTKTTGGFRVVRGGAPATGARTGRVSLAEHHLIASRVLASPSRRSRRQRQNLDDDVTLRRGQAGMTQDQIKGVIFQTLEGHLRAILARSGRGDQCRRRRSRRR